MSFKAIDRYLVYKLSLQTHPILPIPATLTFTSPQATFLMIYFYQANCDFARFWATLLATLPTYTTIAYNTLSILKCNKRSMCNHIRAKDPTEQVSWNQPHSWLISDWLLI